MKILVAIILTATASHALAFDADALTQSNRELAAQKAQKPAWKIKQEAEDAEIKIKSFDPSTAGRTAIIFATQIDEITPRTAMVTVLYRDTPCSLPFADAKHLRAGETLYGRALVPACWGRLVSPLNDEIVIITKFGDRRHDSLINYAEMRILPDGSGRFIKSAYSSDDYRRNVDAYHKALR
ncbi:hypothetical protein DFLDMN_000323 [Cupriavidus sp. H19C3]|uniref:hypothetical protein n=1 Tax=Cupriavidus sp. H19C3 TaxID=3241603 RepID=UPI003BF7FAE2